MAGIDNFTTLMLHMNGADASTTFTDSSISPRTVTPGGNAQIDTAQSVFGGASALFDGTGDYVFSDGSSGFVFGTADFTVDFRARFVSVAANTSLFDFRSSVLLATPLVVIFTGAKLRVSAGNTAIINGTTTLLINTWYHIAVVRSAGVTNLFLDGVSEGTGADTTDYPVGVDRPVLGISGVTLSGLPLSGWIDEFRVSKGVARWTSNFTPPIAAYSVDGISVSATNYAVTANAVTFTYTTETRPARRPLFRRSGRAQWRGVAS